LVFLVQYPVQVARYLLICKQSLHFVLLSHISQKTLQKSL